MKLFDSTNLYYILFSTLTYIFVGVAFYLVVEHVIYQEVEERLTVERRDFEKFIETHGMWDESCYFVENKIELDTAGNLPANYAIFKDTLLYNRYDNEYVPFREHSFISTIGPTQYKVSIRKSLIESNKLLKSITGTMLIVLSIGLLLLFLFQRRIARTIWEPFYATLASAKAFDLNEGRGMALREEKIFEFNELNSVLTKMTDKIARDYTSLKEFTENAAHEIQTPLALINSRVEELIQQSNFSDEQMRWIQNIHESSIRLSRLHQALLLLSKIDNGQFFEHTAIDFHARITTKLQELEEFIAHKSLTVTVTPGASFEVEMNPTLADVLITNLLTNAIRHNVPDGRIDITLTATTLTVANTGAPLTIDPDRLFERFKKQRQSSASLGLGLAIVKKICDNYPLDIHYQYHNSSHTLVLRKTARA
ncbi:sensor histidine kinase [Dawidia soli]|uniref:histidine kinase n=1 Tax=Dawidia soli TaxID=2782352 RepID=A0AAP2GDP0_9BACT|nr:HAMP domain-containing sensor histidine kinase [Dawidia soli]MBT1687529.1 HAMP domain-containing histidine kinase [Dawidia soli]